MRLAEEFRAGIGVFELLGGFEQFLAVSGPYFTIVFIHPVPYKFIPKYKNETFIMPNRVF